MGKKRVLQVPVEIPPLRLDLYLKETLIGIPRIRIKELIAQGLVLVNGKKAKKGDRLLGGETLIITSTGLNLFDLVADPSLPLRMIHEESSFLIVDKPSNIPTHPLKSGEKGTLANALVNRYPELRTIGNPREAGLLHRLDTPTSGLLIVAKTQEVYDFFRKEFRWNQVVKKYLALVWGNVDQKGGIQTGFESKDRKKVKITPKRGKRLSNGKTLFVPLGQKGDQTLLEVEITSGHRHQIRSHLAYLGHPIVGDSLYGRQDRVPTLFLHATLLQFLHPEQNKRVEYRSLPQEERWKSVLKEIALPSSLHPTRTGHSSKNKGEESF